MIYFLKLQWQMKRIDEDYLNRLVNIGRITEQEKYEIMNKEQA